MSEFQSENPAPPTGDISRLAEHLFRYEAGKLVSVLTGIFGIERLQMAEDMVQEALIRALKTWPYYGIPKNPAAWLTQTAKNLALDLIRREKSFEQKQTEIIAFIERWSDAEEDRGPILEGEIKDDRLRLMFACCHPLIPAESQTVLALKTLCGFSPAEIAKAFLTTEVAVAKRLTRARQKIRELHVPFEIPVGEELTARLEAVLQTLYLLFNEGYKASSGEHLVRESLCEEAIRLMTLLVEHPVGNQPGSHALLALMLLNTARLPARTDADGNLLRLKEQDRSLWDKRMIARGMFHLGQSSAGNELTAYHLQAAIASCHCAAADFAATDWSRILALYDRLRQIDDSPIVALNRAVAVSNVMGAKAGMDILAALQDHSTLASYYLLYAVMAEFEMQLDDFASAAVNLRKALELTDLKSEQIFLAKQLRECEARIPSAVALD